MEQLDTQCMNCGSEETEFVFWHSVGGFPNIAFYCRTCKKGEKIRDWMNREEMRTKDVQDFIKEIMNEQPT